MIILFVVLGFVLFEITLNILCPLDPQKLEISDYINMTNRKKTKKLKGRITNPFIKIVK